MENTTNDRTPLLARRASYVALPGISSSHHHIKGNRFAAQSFLPISFLASLGIAATVATTIFAYADLLCADPTDCKGEEQSAYAAVVAVTNGISHAAAILALGPLERLIKTRLKAGLVMWIICRASSVVLLVIGGNSKPAHPTFQWYLTIDTVSFRNIWIAVSGRVFEGLASDNLLHFNLNTVYVLTPTAGPRDVSRLIGTSLGLYMTGTAVAPVAVNVFQSYTTSFVAALAIFATALAYLLFGVRRLPITKQTDDYEESSDGSRIRPHDAAKGTQAPFKVLLSPLQPFFEHPRAIPHGLSLLLYTAVQGHLFPLIMVFASIQFHFDSFHNGLIVSIAAACAALQLLMTLQVLPAMARFFRPRRWLSRSSKIVPSSSHDRNFAIGALLVQAVAISALSSVSSPAQLYVAVGFVSTGLSVPSFMKSHFVALMPDASRAILGLALMESIGGLISPFLLGVWQVMYPGQSVFLFAVGLLGLSLGLFVLGSVLMSSHSNDQLPDSHLDDEEF